MKKYILLMLSGVLLLCFLLTACGGKRDTSDESVWRGMAPEDDLTALAERTEYYDFRVETEAPFDLGLWEQNDQERGVGDTIAGGGTFYLPLSTQFWKGEPVQLWAEASPGGVNVRLYRADGSEELLLQDAPEQYCIYERISDKYEWYMDKEGDFYCYRTNYVFSKDTGDASLPQITIVRILASGGVLYEAVTEPGISIRDFCQTEDGRVYLLLQEEEEEQIRLAELDPSTGRILSESVTELPFQRDFPAVLGSKGDSPAVLGYCNEDDNLRVVAVDETEGGAVPVLYFAGTSYGRHIDMTQQDFRMPETGRVEILQSDADGADCLLERLQMEKVERIPIVVRAGTLVFDDFRKAIALFNQKNSSYHVILEECVNQENLEDFARLTSVQMNAGNGPDLLYGSDLMADYVSGMLEKGALEDLKPYMEADGIREEDYFPLVFSAWRQGEKIYGAVYRTWIWQRTIREEVLGSRNTPDMETLVDALLAREGECLYASGYGADQVLQEWLEWTESLWGMVDWGQGSCNFDTELFRKMLEAAARYGDDGRKSPTLAVAGGNSFQNVFTFSHSAGLEAKGEVICGPLFDDGCYADADSYAILSINANSVHKDGAWEFIRFLLGDEIQGVSSDTVSMLMGSAPVNREYFREWTEYTITKGTRREAGMGYLNVPYEGVVVSEEWKAEYINAIEEARYQPVRTAFVLEIILNEAEEYFKGYKSAEEVIEVINNRVQLYLDENK